VFKDWKENVMQFIELNGTEIAQTAALETWLRQLYEAGEDEHTAADQVCEMRTDIMRLIQQLAA